LNQPQQTRNLYVYGPVKSWRSGTSLGIDIIGDISTCSFNCVYCQLGKIQKVTQEIKTYVPTQNIIEDLIELEKQSRFKFEDLDVITFAGSGEPTLAENLGEAILAIKDLLKSKNLNTPISILTNSTLFNDPQVRERSLVADQLSLKLDAPNDEILQAINQPAKNITIASLISGIKALQEDCQKLPAEQRPILQLQMMFLPKYLNDERYLAAIIQVLKDLQIAKIQINTPSRPKPISSHGEYWIETRGNHYSSNESVEQSPDFIEFKELPVISPESAFELENKLEQELKPFIPDLDIVNVYRR